MIIDKKDLTKHEIQKVLENEIVIVLVKCLEFDKYGRLLANVYCFNSRTEKYDICLSKYLLDNNFAYEYYGGKKMSETDQINTIRNE